MTQAANVYGVDSSGSHVSIKMVEEATNCLKGATPKFWGRYFRGAYRSIGTYEYDASRENLPLASKRIALLPIASSMFDVNKDGKAGENDGTVQAKAFLDAMGGLDYLAQQGSEFYIFLDVEMPSNEIPSLNPDYYLGWSQAIENASNEQVKLLPCMYFSAGNMNAQEQLNSAMNGGAKCYGLWVAGYWYNEGWPPEELPSWNLHDEATPKVSVHNNCPVLIWQFAQNAGNKVVDLNMLNPAYEKETLSRLVIPPNASNKVSLGNNKKDSSSSPDYYVVQSGNTLSEIAAKFGVSLAALEESNPQISNPNLISQGERLKIPN